MQGQFSARTHGNSCLLHSGSSARAYLPTPRLLAEADRLLAPEGYSGVVPEADPVVALRPRAGGLVPQAKIHCEAARHLIGVADIKGAIDQLARGFGRLLSGG